MTKRSSDDSPPLGEAARAKRDAADTKPEERGDRTTLNVDEFISQGGAGPDLLGEALVDCGLISRHQLFNALNDSYSSGRTLREALVALGYVTEEALEQAGV